MAPHVAQHLPRLTAFGLGPVLLLQGFGLLRELPRLPEAGGPAHGRARADSAAPPGSPRAADAPIRLVVTGESTAAGVGVAVHDAGLAGQIAASLAAATGRDVAWTAGGRGGARAADDAWERLGPRGPDTAADVVVLVLGVNDTLALTPVGRWRRAVGLVVEEARARLRPGGLVVLTGVPQIAAFPALPQPMRAVLGAHAAVLDAALAGLASAAGDVVHVPTPAPPDEGDLATDRFHPGPSGYTRWAGHLVDEVLRDWAA